MTKVDKPMILSRSMLEGALIMLVAWLFYFNGSLLISTALSSHLGALEEEKRRLSNPDCQAQSSVKCGWRPYNLPEQSII